MRSVAALVLRECACRVAQKLGSAPALVNAHSKSPFAPPRRTIKAVRFSPACRSRHSGPHPCTCTTLGSGRRHSLVLRLPIGHERARAAAAHEYEVSYPVLAPEACHCFCCRRVTILFPIQYSRRTCTSSLSLFSLPCNTIAIVDLSSLPSLRVKVGIFTVVRHYCMKIIAASVLLCHVFCMTLYHNFGPPRTPS